MMNPIRMLRYVTHRSDTWHALAAEQPSVMKMLWAYIIPMSLLPPIMLNLLAHNHPQRFMDLLPGDRPLIVGVILFLALVAGVLLMAWISKFLAEMVDIKPSYRDALLVIAVATTPLWVASIGYLIPNLALNLALHAIAGLIAVALVYQGILTIFRLHRRGAAAMLTTAIGCTGAVGFGVLLVSMLMTWGVIQDLQFAVKA